MKTRRGRRTTNPPQKETDTKNDEKPPDPTKPTEKSIDSSITGNELPTNENNDTPYQNDQDDSKMMELNNTLDLGIDESHDISHEFKEDDIELQSEALDEEREGQDGSKSEDQIKELDLDEEAKSTKETELNIDSKVGSPQESTGDTSSQCSNATKKKILTYERTLDYLDYLDETADKKPETIDISSDEEDAKDNSLGVIKLDNLLWYHDKEDGNQTDPTTTSQKSESKKDENSTNYQNQCYLAPSKEYKKSMMVESHGNFIAANIYNKSYLENYNPKNMPPTFLSSDISKYRHAVFVAAIKNQNTAKFCSDLIIEFDLQESFGASIRNEAILKKTLPKLVGQTFHYFSEFYCDSRCFFALNKLGINAIKANDNRGNKFITMLVKAKEKQIKNREPHARITAPSCFGPTVLRVVLEYVHSGIFNPFILTSRCYPGMLVNLIKCFDWFNLLEPRRIQLKVEEERRKLISKISKTKEVNEKLISQRKWDKLPNFEDEQFTILGEENENQLYLMLSKFVKNNKMLLLSPFKQKLYYAAGLLRDKVYKNLSDRKYERGIITMGNIQSSKYPYFTSSTDLMANIEVNYVRGLGISTKDDNIILAKFLGKVRMSKYNICSNTSNSNLKDNYKKEKEPLIKSKPKIPHVRDRAHSHSSEKKRQKEVPSLVPENFVIINKDSSEKSHGKSKIIDGPVDPSTLPDFENFKITAKNRDIRKRTNNALADEALGLGSPPNKRKNYHLPILGAEDERNFHKHRKSVMRDRPRENKECSKAPILPEIEIVGAVPANNHNDTSQTWRDNNITTQEDTNDLYKAQLEAMKVLDREKDVVDLTSETSGNSDNGISSTVQPYYGGAVHSKSLIPNSLVGLPVPNSLPVPMTPQQPHHQAQTFMAAAPSLGSGAVAASSEPVRDRSKYTDIPVSIPAVPMTQNSARPHSGHGHLQNYSNMPVHMPNYPAAQMHNYAASNTRQNIGLNQPGYINNNNMSQQVQATHVSEALPSYHNLARNDRAGNHNHGGSIQRGGQDSYRQEAYPKENKQDDWRKKNNYSEGYQKVDSLASLGLTGQSSW